METVFTIIGVLILTVLVIGALRSKPRIAEAGDEDKDGYYRIENKRNPK
jgi:hypothetical protein